MGNVGKLKRWLASWQAGKLASYQAIANMLSSWQAGKLASEYC